MNPVHYLICVQVDRRFLAVWTFPKQHFCSNSGYATESKKSISWALSIRDLDFIIADNIRKQHLDLIHREESSRTAIKILLAREQT